MTIKWSPGTVIVGKRGKYVVQTNFEPRGGQTINYAVLDEKKTRRFMKMYVAPTKRSTGAADFVKRQNALVARLAEAPDYVCTDIEFFENDGFFYKVQEYMDGCTLQKRIEQAANEPPEGWSDRQRLRDAAILTYTVAQVHRLGLVHLDLKPDNCYLAERPGAGNTVRRVVRLLDFDAGFVEGAPRPTQVLGSPGYYSPEHVAPVKFGQLGAHSDVFALGIMLYEILGHRYPFDTEDGFLRRRTSHLADFAPWVPGPVADRIWEAISPRPVARPTADAIYEAFVANAGAEKRTDPPVQTGGSKGSGTRPVGNSSQAGNVGQSGHRPFERTKPLPRAEEIVELLPVKPVVNPQPVERKADPVSPSPTRAKPPLAAERRLVLSTPARSIHIYKAPWPLGRRDFSGMDGAEACASTQFTIHIAKGYWVLAPAAEAPAVKVNSAVVASGSACLLRADDVIQVGAFCCKVAFEPYD